MEETKRKELINQCDSITSEIMWLDNNTRLNVKTRLFNTIKGSRSLYHSEYKYKNNKTGNTAISINLSLNTVCQIRHTVKEHGIYCIMDLNTVDIYYLYNAMEELHSYLSKDFKEFFMKRGNTYIIKRDKRIETREVRVSYGKRIMVDPCIINIKDKIMPGIKLYLDSLTNYVELTLDKALQMILELKQMNLAMFGLQQVRELDSSVLGENQLYLS